MTRLAGPGVERCWARPLRFVDDSNARGTGTSGAGLAMPSAWPEITAEAPFYVKKQQRYFCHPLWNLGLPTPTLRRELRALRFAQQHGLQVPRVLAYGEGSDGRALLALAAIAPALDLEAALQEGAVDRHALLAEVGDTLAHMHRLRLRHGALYPKHILVRADGTAGERVALIDFEKARRPGLRWRCIRDDLGQLLRRAGFLTADDRAVLADAYRRERLSTGARMLLAGA